MLYPIELGIRETGRLAGAGRLRMFEFIILRVRAEVLAALRGLVGLPKWPRGLS
jgi:hypothetical protein